MGIDVRLASSVQLGRTKSSLVLRALTPPILDQRLSNSAIHATTTLTAF